MCWWCIYTEENGENFLKLYTERNGQLFGSPLAFVTSSSLVVCFVALVLMNEPYSHVIYIGREGGGGGVDGQGKLVFLSAQ